MLLEAFKVTQRWRPDAVLPPEFNWASHFSWTSQVPLFWLYVGRGLYSRVTWEILLSVGHRGGELREGEMPWPVNLALRGPSIEAWLEHGWWAYLPVRPIFAYRYALGADGLPDTRLPLPRRLIGVEFAWRWPPWGARRRRPVFWR